MPDLTYGQDKVKKICDALKVETLDPARREAEGIISAAHKKAEEIVKDANAKGEQRLKDTRAQIAQEKATADSALKLAARQTLEALRQSVEKDFFNKELKELVVGKMQQADVVAKLIETVIGAIEKEGIEADLEALIPKGVPADEVNKTLGKAVIERLKSKELTLDDIEGGAKVKLVDEHITLDISDQALTALLAEYIRDDFRELIFSCKS